MNKHNVISIDLAKNVFQVCGFTKHNQVTFNKKVTRSEISLFIAQQEPTLIAMEACYSSHYWARLFESYGHSVKLLPAQHVTLLSEEIKAIVMMPLPSQKPRSGLILSLFQSNQLNNKIFKACIACVNVMYHIEPGL